MDKRVVRTRLAIFNAVLDLSIEKDLDKIKVIELCEKAEINKSTFYLHYTSLEDCFEKCFEFFTDHVINLGDDIDYEKIAEAPEELIDNILNVIEANVNYIERYKKSVIFDRSIRVLKERFVSNICENNGITIENNYHKYMRVVFLVGGCLDAITYSLPNYNRAEIRRIMVDTIKRS